MKTYKYILGEDTYDVFLNITNYRNNGRKAIQLLDAEDGCPFMMVTVNVPEVELAEDEIIVKNYSENEGVLQFLIQNNLVQGVERWAGRDMAVCKWIGEEDKEVKTP